MELPTLSRSERTSSFEVVMTRSLYASDRARPGDFTPSDSPYSAPEVEESVSLHSGETPASPSSRMTRIRMIAEEIRNRAGAYDDVLGALELTFNKEEFKKAFPRRIRELESQEGSQRRFTFHPDYVDHLNSVMMLSADTLNVFLRAAGSERSFSYGSSKYYDGKTFGNILYTEWPVPTIALSIEKRLMDRIAAAHRAINVFIFNASEMPGQEMPRPASPAFTDNSTFASRVMNTLQNEASAFSSPRQEDATWASALEDDAQRSVSRAASEAPDDQPIASTSYVPLDKGKAKDPTEFPPGHAALLATFAIPAERPEGERDADADDEDEQRASQPPQSNSYRTRSRPVSQRSLLSRRSSSTRRSTSSSSTS